MKKLRLKKIIALIWRRERGHKKTHEFRTNKAKQNGKKLNPIVKEPHIWY